MKTIILIVTAVVILAWILWDAWIAWDRTAYWIYMIRGDCGDYWISAECSRCGHIEEAADMSSIPKICPACERKMR